MQNMEGMAGICAVIYLFITFFVLRRPELLGISLKHFFIPFLLPLPSSAQLYVLEVITRLLKTYLPGKTMYPSVGNHEGAPVNRYSFNMPPSTSPSTAAATMAGSHATGHVCRVCTCGQVMSSWVRTDGNF